MGVKVGLEVDVGAEGVEVAEVAVGVNLGLAGWVLVGEVFGLSDVAGVMVALSENCTVGEASVSGLASCRLRPPKVRPTVTKVAINSNNTTPAPYSSQTWPGGLDWSAVSGCPHPLQNLACSGFSVPHVGHCIALFLDLSVKSDNFFQQKK